MVIINARRITRRYILQACDAHEAQLRGNPSAVAVSGLVCGQQEIDFCRDIFGRFGKLHDLIDLATDIAVTMYRAWLETNAQHGLLRIESDQRGNPVFDFLRWLIERGIETEWSFAKYLLEHLPEIIAAIVAIFS